jgi:hypothetical protein
LQIGCHIQTSSLYYNGKIHRCYGTGTNHHNPPSIIFNVTVYKIAIDQASCPGTPLLPILNRQRVAVMASTTTNKFFCIYCSRGLQISDSNCTRILHLRSSHSQCIVISANCWQSIFAVILFFVRAAWKHQLVSQVGCWLESRTCKTAHEQISTSSCSHSNAIAGPSCFLMLLVLMSRKELKDKVDRNYVLVRAVYRLHCLCCRRIHVHTTHAHSDAEVSAMLHLNLQTLDTYRTNAFAPSDHR